MRALKPFNFTWNKFGKEIVIGLIALGLVAVAYSTLRSGADESEEAWRVSPDDADVALKDDTVCWMSHCLHFGYSKVNTHIVDARLDELPGGANA